MNVVSAPPDSAIAAAVAAAASAITFTPLEPGQVLKGPATAGHALPEDSPTVLALNVAGAVNGTVMVAVGDEFFERLQYTSKVTDVAEALIPLTDAAVTVLGTLGEASQGLLSEVGPGAWPGDADVIFSAPILDGGEVVIAIAFSLVHERDGAPAPATPVDDPPDQVTGTGHSDLATSQGERIETSRPDQTAPTAASRRLLTTTLGLSAEVHRLGAIEVELAGVLGETMVSLNELLSWLPGSIIPLHRPVGAAADLRIDETTLARGEVVVIDEHYGLRVLDIAGDENLAGTDR